MEADFSGWATKAGVKCSDGRTIMPDAFKHQDKMTVPLVWQHQHNGPMNVLGHAVLENRPNGVYTYGYFNDTEMGQLSKELVKHKDLDSLSIFAKRLQQQGSLVIHGDITEVSLCLGGANAEAKIDNVNLMHGDQIIGESDNEAIIYTGEELQHENPEGEIVGKKTLDELQHAASATAAPKTDDQTIQDVIDGMTEEQRQAMWWAVGEALNEENSDGTENTNSAAHSASFAEDEEFLAHVDEQITTQIQEGFTNMRNVFESAGNTVAHAERPRLDYNQLKTILDDGPKHGSLKESFLAHADEYGITDINLLFPDATLDSNGITYISRRMEWVQNVLTNTKHSPFSRVKSLSADITADEARAKGYVKGSLKKDEVIKLLKRTTSPKTIYKKQKLDRDDILDITEVDILSFIQAEMRVMLDEEIARAILVGDGREADDEDKIDEDAVRPIAYDVDMYNTTVQISSTAEVNDMIDSIVLGLNNFKGSGTPTLYTTRAVLTKMLLVKDTLGRRLYATKAELAAALTVADIIDCEALESHSDIWGVCVNLIDYQVGADKGGEINLFDFFDIDYNQQKYLLETRISGALIKPKAAVTFVLDAANVVTPQAPTFVNSTGVVTIPTQTGVVYQDEATGATLTAGAQDAIDVGDTLEVKAVPAANYGFTHDATTEFVFTRTA
jgi:HK97 family phage prohead protease